MELLGEMRAVEAVDLLTDLIAFPVSRPWQRYSINPLSDTARTIDKGLPAAAALVKIGEPSIPAIIEKSTNGQYWVNEVGVGLRVLLRLRTYAEVDALFRSALDKEEDPIRARYLRGRLHTLRKRFGPSDEDRSTGKSDTVHPKNDGDNGS